uniref:ABC transporter domain-containing protein n=1 Tax=Meloidogyne incognita TaxID=6306 RepID=A0A914NMK5_MELIC
MGGLDFKLENVDISFGSKQLLSSAELSIVYGRRYGLVGRNGIGKTTLLKMISSKQLIIPSNITFLSVEQEVEGDDTLVIDAVLASDTKREKLLNEERELQERINCPETSDELRTELSVRLDAVYAEQQALQLDKAPARAATILYGLGFKPDEQKKPTKEFSGGWRMRVALARALFIRPDLLLLDEPTNMLDMRAVYWLENHLQEWTGTILTVSHDRKFLNTVCTDMIHLHSKRLDAYKGNYDNFEKAMKEKLTQQQRDYEAQQQHRQHVQEFIDKFRYNAKRASMVQSRIKMLEKLPVIHAVEFESNVTFQFPECEKLGNPVLQLDEMAFRYSKDSPYIFQKVCMGSRCDSRICIVGENGAGKTTLLKLLLGELNPTSGVRNANRRLRIGYFTQHHVDQLEMDDTPLELLAQRFPGLNEEEYRAAMGRFGLSGDIAFQPIATLSGGQKSRLAFTCLALQKWEEYRAAMGRFGLSGDIAFQPIATLSGGQKSRLAFTCLALQKPNYLVMDEPTNHLDVETVDALGKALNKFAGGVVLVSHDERLIELVCKELLVCKDKTITQLDGGLEEYKKHVYRQLAI